MSESPAATQSLYASAEKIYPRKVKGRYAQLRRIAAFVLLGLFYLLPWLSWNGQPLVLFDLPARRFHILGLTLFPQDLILLTLMLATAAMTLFFFTTLAGRLWCGFACPQTVWTEAFLWIEQRIEGDRHQRQKLDAAPWGPRKLGIKGAKHLAWLLFALWTGLSFVAFFMPARELFPAAASLQLSGWPLFWSLFYGFATWGNAGFMREQVCKYMCPYARFQSAMFDKDTLIIGYDSARGEPRKGLAKLAGLPPGDCVDCTLCVQVCPVGIDIRQGLQYECIACAACVDACNGVMDHVGKPRGLVRYTSERHEQEGRFRVLRPRSIGYGLIWLILLCGLAATVLLRSPLELDVLRDRRQLYREMADGSIVNVYTLKIGNKSEAAHTLSIRALREDGSAVELSVNEVEVQPEETRTVILSARMSPEGLPPAQTIQFEVAASGQPDIHRRREARFFGASP